MSWFWFGIISAVADTTRISLTKAVERVGVPPVHPYIISLANFAYLTPLFACLFFIIGFKGLTLMVVGAIVFSALAYVIATILTTKAAECCDLSTTVPFLSFAPVFITITSILFLHESPTFIAFVGILLVVSGGYLIHFNWDDVKKGLWLASFHRLIHDRGAQYIMVVAALFGFVATFNRYSVLALGVVPFLMWWFISVTIINTLLVWQNKQVSVHTLQTRIGDLLPIHVSYILMVTADTMGLSFAIAPLVFAVKRVEILFSVLVGAIFFKEHNLSEKLVAVCIMIIGLALILLGR